MAFFIKITGLDEEIQKLKRLPEVLKQNIDTEVLKAAMDWVAGAKRDAPGDVGFLKGSIRQEKVRDMVYKIGAYTEYAPFIEFGTKGKYRPIPGTEEFVKQFQGRKSGTFKEMIRAIFNWVKRKGIAGKYSTGIKKVKGVYVNTGNKGRRQGTKINQFAEDYALAFVIARSILKKGINPQPFFFKQREIVTPKLIGRIKQLVKGNF